MKHISEILDAYYERIGICMFDGKLDEDRAEALASEQIVKYYNVDIKEVLDERKE